MITHTHPNEYRRLPLPRIPQTVTLCLDCGGTCVALPILGVACLNCRGRRTWKVDAADALAVRREIYKAIELAETAPVILTGKQ